MASKAQQPWTTPGTDEEGKSAPELLATEIIRGIEVLRDTDAPRFQRVAAQITEMARQHALTLTGEHHALREVMGIGKNSPLRQRMREDIREARIKDQESKRKSA